MSASHHAPSGDCVFCCEELTADNFVEYRSSATAPWQRSVYCQQCIDSHFIAHQWQTYLDNIAKADCAAALKRVLVNPPPVNVKDAGFPCSDDAENKTGEVYEFYYHSDGQSHSAKLIGSLLGDERDTFYQEKLAFLTATEVEEERAKAENGANKSASQVAAENAVR